MYCSCTDCICLAAMTTDIHAVDIHDSISTAHSAAHTARRVQSQTHAIHASLDFADEAMQSEHCAKNGAVCMGYSGLPTPDQHVSKGSTVTRM